MEVYNHTSQDKRHHNMDDNSLPHASIKDREISNVKVILIFCLFLAWGIYNFFFN